METSYEDMSEKIAPKYREIIANVEQIVRAKLRLFPDGYHYHCLEHTEQVIHNARAIAAAERISDAGLPLLLIAAWLHDCMIDSHYTGHEAAACQVADSLLIGILPSAEMELIRSSILATKLPQEAPHLLAAILADADLLYLGTDLFFPWSSRLREEHQHVLGRTYTDPEWRELNTRFLREHTYFTKFAQAYCKRGIEFNLSLLDSTLS
ncbi:MAG: phosphohydrolase [Candidatus Kapaibacterium sp.]